MTTRSQDDIAARIVEIDVEEDFFGFRREVLLESLDYEHARPFLNPEVTEAEWAPNEQTTEDLARGYLDFAIGKIRDHRGISASRSVDKLREYAWLLGRDDVIVAMESAEYPQYGAPQVKAFADGMGWPWPVGQADLDRMVQGLPCQPGCRSGCGL